MKMENFTTSTQFQTNRSTNPAYWFCREWFPPPQPRERDGSKVRDKAKYIRRGTRDAHAGIRQEPTTIYCRRLCRRRRSRTLFVRRHETERNAIRSTQLSRGDKFKNQITA